MYSYPVAEYRVSNGRLLHFNLPSTTAETYPVPKTVPIDPHFYIYNVTDNTAKEITFAQAQGYKDLAAFRAAINSDPKWRPKNEDQIVADFKKYIDEMQPRLPELSS